MASDVLGVVLDVEVERPVDLEHEDPAVGQVPLAVGEPQPARAVPPPLLATWWHQPPGAPQAQDVDLGQGLGAAGHVREEGPDVGRTPERAQLPGPAQEQLRGGEPLLDGGGDRAQRGTPGPLPGCEEQDGRLEAAGRRPVRGVPQRRQVAAGADEKDPLGGVEGQVVLDEDGDLVARPVPQAQGLGRRQAREQGRRPGVLEGHPHPLFAREGTGRRRVHRVGALAPPSGPELVPDERGTPRARGGCAARPPRRGSPHPPATRRPPRESAATGEKGRGVLHTPGSGAQVVAGAAT